MAIHCFPACDCCKKEILKDDPPHQTRLEFERDALAPPGVPSRETVVLQRRDLCQACGLRIKQALVQVPESLWLLDEFKVERK